MTSLSRSMASLALVAALCVAVTPEPQERARSAPIAAAVAPADMNRLIALRVVEPPPTVPPVVEVAPPPRPAPVAAAETTPVETYEIYEIYEPVGECGGWESIVAVYWPANAVERACSIMGRETGWTFDPTAWNPISVGGHHACGLFQMMWPLHAARFNGGDCRDGPTNIMAAAGLYAEQGWGPWRL